MHTVLIEQLMDQLIEKSQVRSLSLVNAQHSEASFDKVITFINESDYIQEIDVSWSSVRP